MQTKLDLLAVDPGINAIGICWWATTLQIMPTNSRDIAVNKVEIGNIFSERVRSVMITLEAIFRTYQFRRVVCEWPQTFSGSDKGEAASRSGIVAELAFSVGCIAQFADSKGAEFMLAPVSQWKGQMSKDLVSRRIVKKLGETCYNVLSKRISHNWDACGIGLWSKGMF